MPDAAFHPTFSAADAFGIVQGAGPEASIFVHVQSANPAVQEHLRYIELEVRRSDGAIVGLEADYVHGLPPGFNGIPDRIQAEWSRWNGCDVPRVVRECRYHRGKCARLIQEIEAEYEMAEADEP